MTSEVLPRFSDLLVSLYEASQEAKTVVHFQDLALELVKPLLRFNSSLWASGVATGLAFRATNMYLHNQHDAVIAAYNAVARQDCVGKILSAQGGGALRFNAADFFSGAESSGLRRYTRQFEHENTLIVSQIDPQSQFVQWISFYRAKQDDEFLAADGALGELLCLHLFNALLVSQRTHLLRTMGQPFSPDGALAICDAKGSVQYAQNGFFELLHREGPGVRAGRRLPESVLAPLVGTGMFRGRSITIRARPEGSLLFLSSRVKMPADSLSQREKQVVKHMADGKRHKEIARALALSPATVRTHIQRIHRKLATRNTAELLSAVQCVRS